MYCSHCGKKIKANMLFCPFCGHGVDIPEQDPEQNCSVRPRQTQVESFRPLQLEDDSLWAATTHILPESATEAENRPGRAPASLSGRAPDLTDVRAPGRKGTSEKSAQRRTYAPRRKFNPDDLFLDGDEGPRDDDLYDDAEDDEEDKESFALRHIRGLVSLGLILFAALLIALYYVLTPMLG